MATKRSYDDGCASAHGLDLVGERWALLVVRELMLGPKRFTDLRASLPGISPNVLTERLEELERVSIVQRRKVPPPYATSLYELTEWGRELEPVIMALGRWAARSPALPQGNPMSINSLILSFRAMFDGRAAAGFKGSIEFRMEEQSFHAQIAHGRLDLDRGTAARPDAVVTGDPNMIAAVVYGGMKLPEALRSGQLRVDGDKSVVKRFATFFPLPATAPVTFPAGPVPARGGRSAARG